MSDSKGKRQPKAGNAIRVTWAHATRDVLNRAMSTGQLLPLCVFIILIMFVWRLPAQDLSTVIHEIVQGLENGSLIGWLCSIVLIILWAGHARLMRRSFSEEAERIGTEKTKLQQSNTSQSLGTSDR